MVCRSCRHESLPQFRFCSNCGAALPELVSTSAPTGTAPVGPEYASGGSRLLAILIDGIIISSIATFLSVIFITLAPLYFWTTSFQFLGYLLLATWILIGPVYFCLFTGMRGATPGKMAVLTKVINSQGEKPGLRRAALRELLVKSLLGLLAFGPISVIWVNLRILYIFRSETEQILGYLWLAQMLGLLAVLGFLRIFWHPQKRMWHDSLSGTYVVKVPRRGSEEIPSNQCGIQS